MINVTKTYLPDFEKYTTLIKKIYATGWVTNNGALVRELEENLKKYLDVKHLFFCSNGTITLQIALKALNITKEIITTPFSYVATLNAILWENCTPIFADINAKDFCIDATQIENLITPNTQAILATHVYGLPCNIEAIDAISKKYNIPIIYDAAHAFGTLYNNQSLLSYGDIASCSFHATKVFHSIEGGCLITNNDALANKIYLMRQFGHINDDYFIAGINAKNSEFHAAMGICVLNDLEKIIHKRAVLTTLYSNILKNTSLQILQYPISIKPNYGYYPVVFKNEPQLLQVRKKLEGKGIYTRRYFHPSLNTLPFVHNLQHCPVSEDLASRVFCLPLFYELTENEVYMICNSIIEAL